jgi:hypothetical protein
VNKNAKAMILLFFRMGLSSRRIFFRLRNIGARSPAYTRMLDGASQHAAAEPSQSGHVLRRSLWRGTAFFCIFHL